MPFKLKTNSRSLQMITLLYFFSVGCFAVQSPVFYSLALQRDDSPISKLSSETSYNDAIPTTPESRQSSAYHSLPCTPIFQPSANNPNTELQQCSTVKDLETFISRTNIFIKAGYSVFHLYSAVLETCESLGLFSDLNKIIDSMMCQNIRLGITEMDMRVWNTFFSVYYKRDDIAYGTEFFRYISKMYDDGSKLKPTTKIFNKILHGIAKNRKYEQLSISEIIVNDRMEMHDCTPNQETYQTLMEIYANPAYPRNYLKATELLLKVHKEFNLKAGEGPTILNYKKCIQGAVVSDYNEIIEYLRTSLIMSDFKSAAIAQMIFTKHMSFHSIKPNEQTYLSMMQLYSDLNIAANIQVEKYAAPLWKKYQNKSVSLTSPINIFTYRILLEYLVIHKHSKDVPKSIQYIVLLKLYGFDIMTRWSSIKALLDTVKSFSERNKSVSDILSDDVLSITNAPFSTETQQYIKNAISQSNGVVECLFNHNEEVIPNKEVYQWIINMYCQIPSHDAYYATYMVSNAINQKLFSKPVLKHYRCCFDGAQVEDYNKILDTLYMQLIDDKQFIDIPTFIFFNIMPYYKIKPDVNTYLIMMKILSESDQETHVSKLWSMYVREQVLKRDVITRRFIFLIFNMFIRLGSNDKLQQLHDVVVATGFDMLLLEYESYQAMIAIAKLKNGEMFKSIVKYIVPKISSNSDQLRLYLIQVIRITHRIRMENGTLWFRWLSEKGRLIVFDETMDIDTKVEIKQLELELSLMSIGDDDRLSNCQVILKKMNILKEIFKVNPIKFIGYKLNLMQFDVVHDRLAIYWTLKYIAYKSMPVFTNDTNLIIQADIGIKKFICDIVFKNIGICELSDDVLIISLENMSHFKRSQWQCWTNLKLTVNEYVQYKYTIADI